LRSLANSLSDMKANPVEAETILRYWLSQASEDDQLIYMEKAASERVGSVPHEIWDVHATSGRWWVITNPTNLYAQDAFPSRDEALTFHVGLTVRMITYNDPSVVPPTCALLPAARRRWDQASEALGPAREAEDYQAIGMRLRECLVSLIGEITNDDRVPEDNDRPHAADFKAWFALFADSIAAGSSSAKLRSYLKNTSREVWEYVNWLTHAKNAAHFDAEIGVAITNDLLNAVSNSWLRHSAGQHPRCGECASYSVIAGQCHACGWFDESYVPPELLTISRKQLEARLTEPCTSSQADSDPPPYD
jgi:hypothetical protein